MKLCFCIFNVTLLKQQVFKLFSNYYINIFVKVVLQLILNYQHTEYNADIISGNP